MRGLGCVYTAVLILWATFLTVAGFALPIAFWAGIVWIIEYLFHPEFMANWEWIHFALAGLVVRVIVYVISPKSDD